MHTHTEFGMNDTIIYLHTVYWRRKWQPTPVFLPGESQGRGSLVGCRLWGRTESDTTEATQQQQQQQHTVFIIFYSLNHVRLFVTPWTVAHQASLSIGFPRQELWNRLPSPPPEGLPNPGIEPVASAAPALADGLFTTEPLGKPNY